MDIQCAQCHRHPNDRWTQDDFRALASAFAFRVKKPGATPAEYEVYPDALTFAPAAPRALGGPPLAFRPGEDPRGALMKWAIAKDNPFFARAMVNRVWAYYFGRPLAEPVDGLAAGHPPAHPEVLDELARDFAARDFDLKHLHRRVLNTAAYQRTWRPNPSNAGDERNFSHRILHLLPAEQVVDAINQVTGAPLKMTPFRGLPKVPPTRAVESGTSRPGNLDDGFVLQIFGKPARAQICDCERGSAPSINQVLYLYNSAQLHAKIAADDGRLKKLLAAVADNRKLIEELYLLALVRFPTAAEADVALAHVKRSKSRAEGFEDVLWLLLKQKEFVVNH